MVIKMASNHKAIVWLFAIAGMTIVLAGAEITYVYPSDVTEFCQLYLEVRDEK